GGVTVIPSKRARASHTAMSPRVRTSSIRSPIDARNAGSKMSSSPRASNDSCSSPDIVAHLWIRSTATGFTVQSRHRTKATRVSARSISVPSRSVPMPVTVVVGAQWGDEGKAKIIDLLAKEHTYVVRYQGGHNAGHTVVVGGERYALQLVPSGVLYPHVIPVIGNGVVVDLPTLFREVDALEARGISCADLKVSSRAHLIFPWHQHQDAVDETHRGDDKIGTTLKGIGPAYADKARRVGVRAGEVVDLAVIARTVRARALAENTLIEQGRAEPLDVDEIVERFTAYGERLQPYVADTVTL